VRELVADLRPVRRSAAPAAVALLWLAAGGLFVVTALLSTGSLRPGVAAELASSPRFLVESALGLGAGAAAIYAVARLRIPDATATRGLAGPALLLLLGWGATLAYGLVDPAVDPSNAGMRPGCTRDILIVSGLLLGPTLWLAARAAPLARAWTGALAGAAAAALPASYMQLGCMYDPAHALGHHLLPVAITAALGAALGPLVLRRL
jgi:hypothetical protein